MLPYSSQPPASLTSAEFYQTWPYQKPDDILAYINHYSREGQVKEVIGAMESFSMYYPMYKLSTMKAKFLEDTVQQKKPRHVLEVGSFFGFSALHIAKSMSPQCSLTCIEGNEENARIAREVINRAFADIGGGGGVYGEKNILSRINIVNGLSSEVLGLDDVRSVLDIDGRGSFDFVFLDHDKDCYLPDLKTLESKGLLDESMCTLVADNVVYPGAPEYLKHVGVGRNKDNVGNAANWKTRLVEMPFERKGYETKFEEVMDAMSVSQRA